MRELNTLVEKVKMSDPVVTFRSVCLIEVVVATTFDASSATLKKKKNVVMTMNTTRGVK